MAAAVPSDFSMSQQQPPSWSALARTKGDEKAEGVWSLLVPPTGLLGCSARGAGQRALLESSSSAVLTRPEQIQEEFSCTGRGESLSSRSELRSGKRNGKRMLQYLLSSYFLNLN